MLKQYFNINRFIKYAKYDLSLNAKTYVFFLLALILGLFLIDLYSLDNARNKFDNRDYVLIFNLFSSLILLLVIGTSFHSFRKKVNRFNFLTIPASSFEKFFLQFLFRVIIFPLIFLVLFWLEFKLAKLIHLQFEENQLKLIGDFSIFEFASTLNSKRDQISLLLGLFSVATFFFAGAAWFNKYALVKTLFSFAILAGLSLLFMVMLSHIFYPDQVTGLEIDMEVYKITDNLNSAQFFTYLFGWLSSLFLIPLAYFKLKEKEV